MDKILLILSIAASGVLIALVFNIFMFLKNMNKIKKIKKEIKNKKLSYNQILIHENNFNNNFIQTISVLMMMLLIVGTFLFSYLSIRTQIELSNENINYLKQTSSTNWAHIDMYFGRPGEERIIIDVQDLAKPSKKVTERYSIYYTIINSGKVNSGNIYNTGYFEDENIFTVWGEGGSQSPINVSAQSGKKGILYLSQNRCSSNSASDVDCNSSKLPRKKYDLILKLNCEFCEPGQRIMEKIIPLCIYHNNEEHKYCIENYQKA